MEFESALAYSFSNPSCVVKHQLSQYVYLLHVVMDCVCVCVGARAGRVGAHTHMLVCLHSCHFTNHVIVVLHYKNPTTVFSLKLVIMLSCCFYLYTSNVGFFFSLLPKQVCCLLFVHSVTKLQVCFSLIESNSKVRPGVALTKYFLSLTEFI